MTFPCGDRQNPNYLADFMNPFSKASIGTTLLVITTVLASASIGQAADGSRSQPAPTSSTFGRSITSFDPDWRFIKSDATGAEKPEFDDSAWGTLDVPHDWSIEGPFSKTNPTNRSGGYLPAGVGWYRKHFTLPMADSGRRVFIEFDGVMANSDVWINGYKLGHRPYGYVSFRYELTDHLSFGNAQNVLGVRADNSQQPASRWYTGAGIYRHVRLVVTDPVHIEAWSTFVTTPEISTDRALVHLRTSVVNQSDADRNAEIAVSLLGPDGREIQKGTLQPRDVPSGKSTTFEQDLTVASPQLWDLDHPNLYVASTQVRDGEQILDEERTTFGIRSTRFDADTGFWLNGRNLKLKGVCLHHDDSAFGAAVPLGVWERRLEQLRSVGTNAIRTSHNPPAPEFLDLCDRMGFLVMDEMFDGWTVSKSKYDYHLYFDKWSTIDTRDTVLRDRNHPSIVLYSAGNEVKDTSDPVLAKHVLGSLLQVFHETDPTRPVTQALLRPNTTHDYNDGFADMLDVVGQNYRDDELAAAHAQKPSRKILGTENGYTLKTWLAFRDNRALGGQFLWTGYDYLGESPGWPMVAFNYGMFDRVGTPRPRAFQRQSWWTDQPMVYATRRIAPDATQPTDPGFGLDRGPQVLFPDWTPASLAPHPENVEVYSNCHQVELFLNGTSLGAKARPDNDAPRSWTVAFEPGALRAVATNGGQVVATHELKTADKPARIVLTTDHAKLKPSWDDVAMVEATVVDDNGVLVPTATDLIRFKIDGPGRIVATDSGDNSSHELFQASERHAYQGRCFALIKANSEAGSISVTATASGLSDCSTHIDAAPERANGQ
jgi:beta-galactosidase